MYNTWDVLRHRFLPPVGKVLSLVNDYFGSCWYVEGDVSNSSFVGTISLSEPLTIGILKYIGFEENPLASLKTYDERREIGSYRYTKSKFSTYQIHVILFELDDDEYTTAIFAHTEYSWVTNPIKHYRGLHIDHQGGVNRVREMLREELGHGYRIVCEENPDNKEKIQKEAKKRLQK